MPIKIFFIASLLLSSHFVYSANKFLLKTIRFEGIQRVNINSLDIPVCVGDRVNESDIHNIIHTLFSTGYFEDIQIFRDNRTLFIKVKERPIISHIYFSGNVSVKDKMLRKNLNALQIQVGKVFKQVTLSKIKQNLEKFYRSIGKYCASVKVEVVPIENNCVNLNLVMQEGSTAEIRRINFVGNQVYDSKELISHFYLSSVSPWWSLINDNKYQKKKLVKELKRLNQFYLNQGYIQFKIDLVKINLSQDKKEIYITINVTEGNRYNISGIKVSGNLIGHSEEIKNIAKTLSSGAYSGIKLSAIEEKIKNLLIRCGYAYPILYTYLETLDFSKLVKIHISVYPGNCYYVRKINFSGNCVSQDSVLRREIEQMEGSWFINDLVVQGKKSLERTGYFKNVQIKLLRVLDRPRQIELTYKVKEHNMGSFHLGTGYGTESGISLQAGIQQGNWLGTGYSASIKSIKKYGRNYAELSLTNPYFKASGISLSSNTFYEDFKADNVNLSTYTKKSYGINSVLGFSINLENSISIGIGYTYNSLLDIQPQIAVWRYFDTQGLNLNKQSISNNFSSRDFLLNFNWTFSNLDKALLPTQGSQIDLDSKVTLSGSDSNFCKFVIHTATYFPIDYFHHWILLSRIHCGYGNSLKNKEMPFYENFYAKGVNAIRGFQSDDIGPKAAYLGPSTPKCSTAFICKSEEAVGGNAMGFANFELITPTPFINDRVNRSVRTSFFIDAGTIWDTHWIESAIIQKTTVPNYSNFRKIRFSAGIEFQWQSPLGPLVFSYAQPFKKYNGDKVEPLQFNIGKIW